ncbi:MAG TPA: AMP-dependent synthetase, partial [Chloroflexi bacterium]|nr:AMP-dependent synthetase [Chloroflexota bacterium]
MLVQNFLENSAQHFPAKTALICGGQRLSYAQLDQQANRLANALQAGGFGRGDRLVIYLPNSVEAVLGIFATLKAGGTFVVVNHTTKADKLVYILNNCRAAALLTNRRNEKLARDLGDQVPSLNFRIISGSPASGHKPEISDESRNLAYLQPLMESAPATQPINVNIDLDLAGLIYTSGSTGDPKGVMSDHSNVDFATSSIISYLQNTPDDIVMNVLPLSFDYGLYQLLMVFKFGGTLVLEQSFTYPAAILKRIEDEKVTGFPGVPTVFAILVQMDLSTYDLSSLRYLTNTAAALPPSHILQLRDKFPWATLYSMYGLTETKRTLYLPPDQLDIRPDSVGIAIPGTEVWLEDEAGQRLG